MSFRERLTEFLEPQLMLHRPPLSPRFWAYSVFAYVTPVVVQVVFPEDPTLTDELIWLVTLAPAFLLSLHYGLRGAMAALVMGTALFLVVQFVVAVNFTPDDWRITVPTYLSYGVLAISVGWLSEQLHSHYQRVLDSERMAALGQLALTVKHEVNNALTAIVAESEFMMGERQGFTSEQKKSVETIRESAMRIAQDIGKITSLETAPVTAVVGGAQMVDLDAATYRRR